MSAAPRRKSRAPLFVAIGSTAIVLGLGAFAYVRGTSAETTRRDPTRVADGIVCQLYRASNGREPTRCAMIVAASVDEVSAVVRDYEHFAQTFDSSLGAIELRSIERAPDGSVRLVGHASTTFFGDWPIDVRVAHGDEPGGERVSSWSEPAGEPLNRGRWIVSPAPEGALLVYELEVESPWAPRFLVNSVLATQLAYPVRRVAERVHALRRRADGQT